MKTLLVFTAAIEIATGIALLTIPGLLAPALLGATLDTPAGLAVARLAGAALLSLGIACWFGSRDTQSRAAAGIVAAMLFYNLAAATLLLSLRYFVNMTGIGLLPASVLHAALAVWCIACLRATKPVGSLP
ncbi:MAG: hypothetical protein IV108_01545 [Burkholderiales bacterium]|nr:hypothetical protein [Burkholderiales bacterium]